MHRECSRAADFLVRSVPIHISSRITDRITPPRCRLGQAHFYTIRMHGTTAKQRPSLSLQMHAQFGLSLADTPHQGLMTETSHLQLGPGKSFKPRTQRRGASSLSDRLRISGRFLPLQPQPVHTIDSQKEKFKGQTTTCILGS